ncbi:DUF2690 domain-containing protein, partial [Streptomyces sp. SID10815]|uniref:DUF2690 domain-containing protein n=1 Tax=Streptomyces sp. SID10815 TaxID=2706027 RepID=UPI0013C63659
TAGRLVPGIAGPAGVSPTVPLQPTASEADGRTGAAGATGAAGRERAVPGEPRDARRRARASWAIGSETEDETRSGAEEGTRRKGKGKGDGDGDGEGAAGTGPTGTTAASSPRTAPDLTKTPGSGTAPGSGKPSGSDAASSSGGNSWRVAGYRGPAPMGGKRASLGPGAAGAQAPGTPAGTPGNGTSAPYPAGPAPYATGAPNPYGPSTPNGPHVPNGPHAPGAPGAPGTPGTPAPGASGPNAPYPSVPRSEAMKPPRGGTPLRRQVTMFLAGLVTALLVMGVVFYVTGGIGGGKAGRADGSPSPTASPAVRLPPGVKCVGAGCTGKDAEAMGCSRAQVSTSRSVTVGTTLVEVRYSKTCGAAWGRITQAAQGDRVRFKAGGREESDTVDTARDTIAYTPMVAVPDAGRATACVTLAASGRQACTR